MSARSDRIILTFFGSGYFPVAPGTAGSMASLAVGAVLWFQLPETFQPWLFPLLTLLSMAGCVLPGDRIQEIFGRKDPGAVVIDEAAGTDSGRIGNLNPQSVVSKNKASQ